MSRFRPPMCLWCSRLRAKRTQDRRATCSAFPKGIPEGIWWEGGEHRLPWPGDGGKLFNQAEDKEPLPIEVFDAAPQEEG